MTKGEKVCVLSLCYICVVICFKIYGYMANGYMIYMTMLQYFMTHAGENKNTCYISICYNLFTAGGVSLQGEFSYTGGHHQKGGEC